jgi:hypothetical protein
MKGPPRAYSHRGGGKGGNPRVFTPEGVWHHAKDGDFPTMLFNEGGLRGSVEQHGRGGTLVTQPKLHDENEHREWGDGEDELHHQVLVLG